jgi:ABC-type lipoprotein export system ATPase subunit
VIGPPRGAPLVIECRGVAKWYGDTPGDGLVALAGVDLDIAAAEIVALRGPSGSGKSTLLNVLGCLDRPSAGTYKLGGLDVSSLDREGQAWVRLHYLGFVFQSFHLISHATALENVMLPLTYAGVPAKRRLERARALLARVGLSDREDHRPMQLSGGQRQRVAIARSLAVSPRVLLADEPTGALDSKTGKQILELLVELRATEGVTVILVTHDPGVGAAADRQIHLLDGRIVAIEPRAAGAA